MYQVDGSTKTSADIEPMDSRQITFGNFLGMCWPVCSLSNGAGQTEHDDVWLHRFVVFLWFLVSYRLDYFG